MGLAGVGLNQEVDWDGEEVDQDGKVAGGDEDDTEVDQDGGGEDGFEKLRSWEYGGWLYGTSLAEASREWGSLQSMALSVRISNGKHSREQVIW